MTFEFPDKLAIILIHDEQLAEHGGSSGIRDEGLLESALARPLNLLGYGEPSLSELAASLAFGIARNRPFVYGNKRTAFLAAYTLVNMNGYDLEADQADVIAVVLDLAAGELTESELAHWLESKLVLIGG